MKNSFVLLRKNLPFVILLVTIMVSFSACSQDNTMNPDASLIDTEKSDMNRGDCFDRFKKVLAENNNLANIVKQLDQITAKPSFSFTRSSEIETLPPEEVFPVSEDISNEALTLLTSLNFSNEEIETLTGENKEVESLNEEEKLALALLAYSVDDYIHSNEFSTFSHVGISPFGMPATRSITFMETVACFAEAAGITEGVRIIGALAKGVVGKAAIRELVIFIGLKIGFRTLSGIGLALITAEIAYCIYRKAYTCEITVPVPDWWSPQCGISLSEANELPIVVNDYNGNIVYSDISLDEIGKRTAVFRRLNIAAPVEPEESFVVD